MKLTDLCNVVQDISNINVTILSDASAYTEFCNTWKFHDQQNHLQPDSLNRLLQMLNPMNVIFYLDCYRIYFTFLWLDEFPIAIGPYCTKILTETDYNILVKQNRLSNLPAKDVLTYRSRFSITTESHIMHLIQCLVKHASKDTTPRTPIYLDANTYYEHKTLEEYTTYKPYSILIQERYKKESEFMENIRHGKRTESLNNWRELHNSVDYLKHSIGYTIENARMSAAVTRTLIRIAGIQAGLPAELSDQMTGQSSRIIRHAKNIEEINKEHESLIQSYCNAIHAFRTKHYSSLVLSCIYHLEHMYQNEVIISTLADELDVSVNHLISQFHKETGITPGQYLRRERMQHAAWLLTSSKLSIQDICSQVGIHDATYFSKQFRREYNETPSEYRRKRKL